MTCSKCGSLAFIEDVGDFYEQHSAVHCLTCGKVEWLEPVPYAPPDQDHYHPNPPHGQVWRK